MIFLKSFPRRNRKLVLIYAALIQILMLLYLMRHWQASWKKETTTIETKTTVIESKRVTEAILSKPAVSSTQNERVLSVNPVSIEDERAYIIIIDGIIFQLQAGNPKGISVVWKNLIPELAKHFKGKSKLFFINRDPGASSPSSWIASQPNVNSVLFTASIEETIEQKILGRYRYHDDGRTSKSKENPLLFFISTYYTYPSLKGICYTIMYHDLIPENVGYNCGPDSEYFPRIDALQWINSVVSVSHSTSRDLMRLYGEKIRKKPSDEYAYDDLDTNPETKGTIISTVPNRISRDLFHGPASSARLHKFRRRYRIADASTFPPFHESLGIPLDYFMAVGSAHSYKNSATMFAAADLLPDEILRRVQFVLVGRGLPTQEEMNGVRQHPLVVTRSDGYQQTYPATATRQSEVPVRFHTLSYIEERDLPAAYSGALALVYISSFEGFGLPLAEAMTSGTLAVTTNQSSMPEVGGPDSIYVNDPTSAEQVKNAMMTVLEMSKEERQTRIQNGMKWVAQYGGGPDGQGHGWDEMAGLIAAHIRGRKQRGDVCYHSYWKQWV